MNSHTREPPLAQFPEKNDTSRQNGHGPDPGSHSRGSELQPPSGPGGRRSHSRKSQRTEPMDVDPPAPAHLSRMQENRSTSTVIPDRDDTKGDLPRGPKAMTSKLPSAPPTVLPSKPTTLSERYPGRSPPPHLIIRDERPPQRTGDRSIVDSHPDRYRDMPREHRNLEIALPRRRSPEPVRTLLVYDVVFLTHVFRSGDLLLNPRQCLNFLEQITYQLLVPVIKRRPHRLPRVQMSSKIMLQKASSPYQTP